MKRIGLLLAVVLLLAGCAGEPTPTTAPSTAPVETEPAGLYQPDSQVEKDTDGAVRAYKLEGENYRWVAPYGEDLLLATGAGRLTLLSGERRAVKNTAVTGKELSVSAAELGQTYACVYYLDKSDNELIVLDASLEQSHKITVPEGFKGVPVLNGKTMEVFYSDGRDVRAFDPDTQISRLVKQQSCESCQILDSCFDGNVLICENVDTLGQRHVLYVDASTGQTLTGDDHVYQLNTYQDTYFAMRLDGIVRQQIVGKGSAAPVQLHIPESQNIMPVLSLGGIVGWHAAQNGAQLDFYETGTGNRTASVVLPEGATPIYVTADNSRVWVLVDYVAGQYLYSWDVSKTPVTDETVYLSPLYTQSAPDEAGLAQCQTKAQEVSDRFGVRVQIWQEAVKRTGGYNFQPEYQTEVISQWIDGLAAAMEGFPENFFVECAEEASSGCIRICLARSIASGEAAVYFHDNEQPYIVMTPGTDVQKELTRVIGYLMDTHLVAKAPTIAAWDTLSGEGFVYGQTPAEAKYLEGESRAFVDESSMLSPQEDRAKVFRMAADAQSAELFQAPALQAKLLCLCQSIRESFGLTEYAEALPWEQYLQESLAFVPQTEAQ